MNKQINSTNSTNSTTSKENQKTVVYFWMSWNLEKIEAYLEKMESEGWLLVQTSMAHTVLKFEKSTPQKVRFRLDFQAQLPETYKVDIEEMGWQLVGDSNGWLLWKQTFENEPPTLVLDRLSLKAKSRRMLMYVAAILVTQIPMYKIVSSEFSNMESILGNIPLLMYVVIVVIMIYSAFRLYKEGTK